MSETSPRPPSTPSPTGADGSDRVDGSGGVDRDRHASLERFVAAQDEGATHERALEELGAARKTTHWMWFVLPQLAGLGTSEMARRYAIADLDEARRYLAHPVLGPRLQECVAALRALPGHDPVAVLGGIDATKLRSSITLFARAAAAGPDGAAAARPFLAVLEQYFGGSEDPATAGRL